MLKQSRNALTHLAKRYRAVLRRCRLCALALALACALTALPPLPAGAANSGGTVDGNGNYVGSTTGTGGDVVIDSDVQGDVYGGFITYSRNNAYNNRVTVTGGTVGAVIGGHSDAGDSTNNTVSISGGTVLGNVIGGRGNDQTTATYNKIILSGAPDLSRSKIFGGRSPNVRVTDLITGNHLILLTSGRRPKTSRILRSIPSNCPPR